MIPSPALAAWLADPERAARLVRRGAGERRQMGPSPADDPARAGDRRTAGEDARGDPRRRRYRSWTRSDDIEALFDDLIAGCRADPFFRPPIYPLSSEIHSGPAALPQSPSLARARRHRGRSARGQEAGAARRRLDRLQRPAHQIPLSEGGRRDPVLLGGAADGRRFRRGRSGQGALRRATAAQGRGRGRRRRPPPELRHRACGARHGLFPGDGAPWRRADHRRI